MTWPSLPTEPDTDAMIWYSTVSGPTDLARTHRGRRPSLIMGNVIHSTQKAIMNCLKPAQVRRSHKFLVVNSDWSNRP